MKIIFIGFDINGNGGISTYSRYQIRALRESNNNVIVQSLNSFEIVNDIKINYNYNYKSKLILIKVLIDIIFNIKNTDLIIFNHVNISFLGAIINFIFGVKYIIFGYNVDVLKKLRWLSNMGFVKAESIVIDCQYTINRLAQFHKKIPKTHLLYDPVDTDFYRIIDKKIAREKISKRHSLKLKDKFIICTVALMRLSANKGHRQIIDSMKLLKNKNLLYFILSDGKDKKNLEEYVKINKLENQVIFFGFVDYDFLPYFYSSSDIAALISNDDEGKGEGVPLGLIEASSCGTPILCGNKDGSLEAISKEINGYALEPGNTQEIAEKINHYFTNKSLLKAHGSNGRSFIVQNFGFRNFRKIQNSIISDTLSK